MSDREYHIKYKALKDRNDLSEEYQQLLDLAEKSAQKAYAPYSKFRVGASVLLTNGKIFTGNNQENAAYPVSLCAERVALFSAKAQYPDEGILAIAVFAKNQEDNLKKAVSPCGSCRQAIAEYETESKPIDLILAAKEGEILVFKGISSLLPFSFGSEFL
jgi:cytidine deaminase